MTTGTNDDDAYWKWRVELETKLNMLATRVKALEEKAANETADYHLQKLMRGSHGSNQTNS